MCSKISAANSQRAERDDRATGRDSIPVLLRHKNNAPMRRSVPYELPQKPHWLCGLLIIRGNSVRIGSEAPDNAAILVPASLPEPPQKVDVTVDPGVLPGRLQ